MLIRVEAPEDRPAVRAVNLSVFETSAEANLVDTLRKQTQPVVSLVAEESGAIAGHIMFSPVLLGDDPTFKIMGLAPMAVSPESQHKGIGSALICAGLERCKRLGVGAVVVLGHPEYYPRFGFLPSTRFGIGCEYDVPEEVFMILELQPGYLRGRSGMIKYHVAFSNL
ncbi:MAG: N-acetyltransferase [Gammaproteobacteria bacterium]|nr:N-acetyltransferase [Gammaproteobacteria bacterium]